MWWTPLTYGALNEKTRSANAALVFSYVISFVYLFRIFGSMGKPA